jgi:hypothetical protein
MRCLEGDWRSADTWTLWWKAGWDPENQLWEASPSGFEVLLGLEVVRGAEELAGYMAAEGAPPSDGAESEVALD